MFALHERHKRLGAEHAAGVLRQRLAELAKVTINAFDDLWESAPGEVGRKVANLDADIAALTDESLPPAPFEPTSTVRYRPVPDEHARRREAQKCVDEFKRAIFQLQQYARSIPRWVENQRDKPNSDEIREALRAELRNEVNRILRPLMRRAPRVEDVMR